MIWLAQARARHRRKIARRRLISARRTVHRALDRLDDDMATPGYCRQERRQFWRELIAGRVEAHDIIEMRPVKKR